MHSIEPAIVSPGHRSRGIRTVVILFLCLSVIMQMLGVPPTLLSPALSLDTLGESVLEGFSSLLRPCRCSYVHPNIICDGRPTVYACADSCLRTVSSSCSLVSFLCFTSQLTLVKDSRLSSSPMGLEQIQPVFLYPGSDYAPSVQIVSGALTGLKARGGSMPATGRAPTICLWEGQCYDLGPS